MDQTRDAVAILLAQNAIRAEDLLPVRNGRMAASPWTFYRGAAAVMAADLGSRPHSGLTVQLCGDAHLLNFGLWATPERNLSFDLRDFDETLPGPFEWDLARLVASIVVLARTYGVRADRAEEAVAACLRTYRERMTGYTTARWLDIWYDLIAVDRFLSVFADPDKIRAAAHIERKARKRTHSGAFRKLTERRDGHLRITEDPPIRQHRDDGLAEELFAAYRHSLPDDRRLLLDRFTLVDTVRQVVGVGSVGMRVHLALLVGRDQDDPLFLQIKQAGTSVYESSCGPSRYDNHGRRVVEGKRLVQSATDIFVGWTAGRGHDYYVRQFRDMKVIANGELISPLLGSSPPPVPRCWPARTRAPAIPSRSPPTSAGAGHSTRPWPSSRTPTPIRPSAITANWSTPSRPGCCPAPPGGDVTGVWARVDHARVREHAVDSNDGIIASAGIVEGLLGAGARQHDPARRLAGRDGRRRARPGGHALQRNRRRARRPAGDHSRPSVVGSTLTPAEEEAELAELYQARGLSPQLARAVAAELSAGDALAAHAEAEYGISLRDRPATPWTTAVLAGLAFAARGGRPAAGDPLAPPHGVAPRRSWRLSRRCPSPRC